jgi:hypothetical protein
MITGSRKWCITLIPFGTNSIEISPNIIKLKRFIQKHHITVFSLSINEYGENIVTNVIKLNL